MNQDLENTLSNKKIKPTAMRLLVLKFLTEQSHAVSLKSLEAGFHKADTSTLYRTLKTFEENKLIHSIDDGTGQMKYALCLESCKCQVNDVHYHFHCNNCQETFCLTEQNIPNIALPKGFNMVQANLVLKGTCANCNL
jgi:Fur family ferric uptake transcriptional regulator